MVKSFNAGFRSHRLLALALPWLLSACAVELQNRQASDELARAAKPAGSVYTGWRVFQEKCATCHGPAATGTGRGPNLLPTVSQTGPRRFAALVLRRYDWAAFGLRPPNEGEALDTMIEQILQRQEGVLAMPAWQGEPRVSAHIADLYAYLSARAEGTQGPGRPTP